MRQFGGLDAVYDITVAYPYTLPQSELDLLRGRFPEEIHFHITRHEASTIPSKKSDLKGWLEDRWRAKEDMLHEFYSRGEFPGEIVSQGETIAKCVPLDAALCLALIFWTGLVLSVACMLWYSTIARLYTAASAVVFVLLSLTGGGAHRVELTINRWWEQHRSNAKQRSQ